MFCFALHSNGFDNKTITTMAAPLVAHQTYKANLAQFFTWLQEIYEYEEVDPEFPAAILQSVTHDDFFNYLVYLSFGTTNPTHDNNLNVQCRHSTLLYKKKSISWFFRHHNVDNKTSSPKISEFLKAVKKMEVRGKGIRSSARRPTENGEFEQLITMLKSDSGNIKKYGIPAMLCYQFSMICRSDDATQLTTDNIEHHGRFPQYALHTRLTWSKNVAIDAPWQTLIGCTNTNFCNI